MPTEIKYKEKNDNVDTQLELLKYATQVQSNIRTNITSDFTLCKLNEQDKEGITNMTVNAYVVQRKITNMKRRSKWWTWENKQWKKTTPQNKLLRMDKLSNEAFDMYMTKVMMTAILNRNVDKNYLVNFLKQTQQPEYPEEEPTTEKKIKNKIIKDKNETPKD